MLDECSTLSGRLLHYRHLLGIDYDTAATSMSVITSEYLRIELGEIAPTIDQIEGFCANARIRTKDILEQSVHDYSIRPLDITNMKGILKVQDLVLADMPIKEHLHETNVETFQQALNLGISLGLFDRDKLIGFVIYGPKEIITNSMLHKLPSEYHDAYEANTLLFKLVSMVLPAWRGCGLQALFGAYLEQQALSKGYTHAVVTFHPDNTASMKNNIEMLEYEAYALIDDYYGGLVRRLCGKRLDATVYRRVRQKIYLSTKPLTIARELDNYIKEDLEVSA